MCHFAAAPYQEECFFGEETTQIYSSVPPQTEPRAGLTVGRHETPAELTKISLIKSRTPTVGMHLFKRMLLATQTNISACTTSQDKALHV